MKQAHKARHHLVIVPADVYLFMSRIYSGPLSPNSGGVYPGLTPKTPVSFRTFRLTSKYPVSLQNLQSHFNNFGLTSTVSATFQKLPRKAPVMQRGRRRSVPDRHLYLIPACYFLSCLSILLSGDISFPQLNKARRHRRAGAKTVV